MPGGMQDLDGKFSNLEVLSVLRHMDGKFCLGPGSINYGRTCGLAQVKMTADKISMKMRFENIRDPGLPLVGHLQVNINIAQGINDRRLTFTFNIICCF